MGNPNPSPKTRFRKGQTGNPSGGRLHNPVLRKIRKLTMDEVAELGAFIITKNVVQLKKIIADAQKNPETKSSALKIWFATIAIKGISKGDAYALDTLLNRLIGKVPTAVELTGKNGGPIENLSTEMTREERLAMIENLAKRRKEVGND